MSAYQGYLQLLDAVFRYHLGKESDLPGMVTAAVRAAAATTAATTISTSKPQLKIQIPIDPSVAVTAMQCLCELLISVPHFNYRLNLLSAVVSGMGMAPLSSHSSSSTAYETISITAAKSEAKQQVTRIACDAMGRLFERDVSGEVSCEGVRLVARMCKAKGFAVAARVIKTFLRLRLREEVTSRDEMSGGNHTGKRKEKEHVSKKMKKQQKHDAELDKEMKEAEAEYSREEKMKWVRNVLCLSTTFNSNIFSISTLKPSSMFFQPTFESSNTTTQNHHYFQLHLKVSRDSHT